MSDPRPHAVWLVRHGETAWTASRQHTGRTDIPLSDLGERHARAVRTTLAGRSFALVLTSPLARARTTCTLAGYGDVALPEPDLMEWDYGQVEGKTTDEFRATYPGWLIWDDGPPGGETADQVGVRADRVIARCASVAGEVALFGHAHQLRILAARWLSLPAVNGRHFLMDTASISVLGWERDTRAIASWNHPAR